MELYHPRCKICTSKYSKEINELLNQGRPYSEILGKYGDRIPKFKKSNITNHKHHYPVIPQAVKEHQKQLELGKRKIIDDLEFIEKVKTKANDLLETTDNPGDVQKLTASALHAIKLKYEISGDINNPLKDLLDLLKDDSD